MARKTTGIFLLLIATSGCAGPPWLARETPGPGGPKAFVPPAHDKVSAAAAAKPGLLANQQLTSHLLPGGESPRQQIPPQSLDGQHLIAPPLASMPGAYSTPYTPVYDQPSLGLPPQGLPPQTGQFVGETVAVAVQRQNLTSAPPANELNESPAEASPLDTTRTAVRRDAAFNINDAEDTSDLALPTVPDTQAVEPTPPPAAPKPLDVRFAIADAKVPNAGVPNAGAPNAGAPNAGAPNAGVPNAGTPNAGAPNAGVPDAGEPDGQVVQASHITKRTPDSTPGRWRDAAAAALTALEQELTTGDFSEAERARLNANSRLLHAILNDSNQAVRPIEEFDADEREYWKHLTQGLLTSLDADGKHTSSRRSALALHSIRQAADHLANISTLDVLHLAFCSKVESYGRFDEFKAYGFQPGQEVLLYVEVENFAVASTGDRHETELQGEYTIFSADGQRVANAVLPLDKQASKNRRHDYFIAYRVFLPKKIEQGHYTLQLTIEDLKGGKSNQASVEFWIR